MNLSKNLIVALLGLGCYARSNSINLANNTTILLIILALMAKHNTNDDNNIEIANNTRTTINGCACANDIGYTAPTRVIYQQPYNCYPTYNHGYCYQQYQPIVRCEYPTTTCPISNQSWNYNHCAPCYTYSCNNCLY